MKREYKIIISGGGTGGHIFPALSIADAIKSIQPNADILFVGAENRMEMQRVPEAGYKIVGLPIAGFNRKQLWKNIKVLWLILKSQRKARKVIKDFKPQVVVGVGRTRGDRHPSRVEAKNSALLSSHDGYLLELTGWTKGSQAS